MSIIEIPNEKLQYVNIIKHNTNHIIPDVEEPLPQTSFFMLICGRVNSGKSSLMFNLLRNKRMYKNKFHRIFMISPSYKTINDKCIDYFDYVSPDFNDEALQEIKELINKDDDDKFIYHNLLILDDCVAQIEKNSKIFLEFCLNRRHMGGGVSIMLTTQQYRKIPLIVRNQISCCVFFQTNNSKELEAIYEEYGNYLSKEQFKSMTKLLTDNHDFLYFDNTKNNWYHKFNLLEFK
jgi:hypothetical protein